MSAGWTGRSRGKPWGYVLFLRTIRLLGRRGAYLLVYLVLPYYFLAGRDVRAASHTWFDHLRGKRSWWRRQRDAWKHMQAFARSLIDSLIIAMGREEQFTYSRVGREHLIGALEQGRGVVLLSAHVGGRAVGGRLLPSEHPLNLVAYDNEAEAIKEAIERYRIREPPRIIPLGDGANTSLQILRALRRGEIVAMLADRTRDENIIRLPFLGREAAFPVGPFLVAVLSGAPVVTALIHKRGGRELVFEVTPAMEPGKVSRDERDAAVRELAQAYVRALEAYARAHPYQWFNFYDFWR